jgi:hypothetical protein
MSFEEVASREFGSQAGLLIPNEVRDLLRGSGELGARSRGLQEISRSARDEDLSYRHSRLADSRLVTGD